MRVVLVHESIVIKTGDSAVAYTLSTILVSSSVLGGLFNSYLQNDIRGWWSVRRSSAEVIDTLKCKHYLYVYNHALYVCN